MAAQAQLIAWGQLAHTPAAHQYSISWLAHGRYRKPAGRTPGAADTESHSKRKHPNAGGPDGNPYPWAIRC